MESVTSGYEKRCRADYDARRTNRRASDDCGMLIVSHKRVSETASCWLVLDQAPSPAASMLQSCSFHRARACFKAAVRRVHGAGKLHATSCSASE